MKYIGGTNISGYYAKVEARKGYTFLFKSKHNMTKKEIYYQCLLQELINDEDKPKITCNVTYEEVLRSIKL